MRTAVLASLLATVCAAGQAAEKKPPAPGPTLKASLDAVDKKFEEAVAKGDAKAITALYAADAQLLPPQSEAIPAGEAMTKYWQGMIDSGAKGLKLTTLEADGHGESAHAVGTWEVMDAGGKVVDKGKFVVLYKHDKDGWKLHRDIWNSSMPPAAPAK